MAKYQKVGNRFRSSYYDLNGKRNWISEITKERLAEAIAKVKREVAEGRHISKAAAGTLAPFAQKYFEQKAAEAKPDAAGRSHIGPGYVVRRQGIFNTILRDLVVDGKSLGEHSLVLFSDPTFLQRIADDLRLIPSHSLDTTKAHFAVLVTILRAAAKENRCPAIAADLVVWPRPIIADKRVKIPTLANIKKLLIAAEKFDSDRKTNAKGFSWKRSNFKEVSFELFLRTGFQTGCRPEEIQAVGFSRDEHDTGEYGLCLDLDKPVLRVGRAAKNDEKALCKIKGTTPIGSVKSSAAFREIPLGPDLVKRLKQYRLETGRRAGDLLFEKDGGVIHYGFLSATLRKLCKTNDIKWYAGLHTLRHVCASLWIEQNRNPKWISTKLGHANISLTFDTYGHLFDDNDDVEIESALEIENRLYK